MNVIFGIAVAFLVIGSVLIQHWPVIEALSGGAAAFLGALVGAAAGLGAILAGALYNAKLNRDENKRLRQEEARALCLALASELRAVSNTAKATAKSLAEISSGKLVVASIKLLEPPDIHVFTNTTDKIGLLPVPALDEIMAVQMYLQKIRSVNSALLLDDPNTPVLDQTLHDLGAQYAVLAIAADKAARIVGGEQPAEIVAK